MNKKDAFYYSIFAARDPKYDGVFYIGVTSTGIYCRPICRARLPKPANCRFFTTAQLAHNAGFRACLRCRPELAPGAAPVDDAQRIAHAIAQHIETGKIDGLESIADQFELSSRQIRRIMQKIFGKSAMDLIQIHRLKQAQALLTSTRRSVTDIAFASGFSSVRRFNDAFRKHYHMSPSHLRKEIGQKRA